MDLLIRMNGGCERRNAFELSTRARDPSDQMQNEVPRVYLKNSRASVGHSLCHQSLAITKIISVILKLEGVYIILYYNNSS